MTDMNDYIAEKIEWFITTDSPMTLEQSRSILSSLIRLAFIHGQHDQLTKDAERLGAVQ